MIELKNFKKADAMNSIPVQLNGRQGTVDCYPNVCPICHVTIEVKTVYQNMANANILELLFCCANKNCKRLFIAEYQKVDARDYYRYARSYPKVFLNKEIPQELQDISPEFYDIYCQAMVADHHKLHQLVGMGLRKSLEFLIKDYCIKKHPGEKAAIKASLLSGVITKYIQHSTLQDIAKRTAWLGNDETHYERKWEDKDIDDLKRLHEITQQYLIMEIHAEKYISEMPENKKDSS